MAFQPKDFILDSPVSSGFSFADLQARLIHQSKPTPSPSPPPRSSSFTESSLFSSSAATKTTHQASATRKRTCYGSSDTCSFMSNVDDSESVWTSRTSSGMTTPEPRASAERLHLKSSAALNAALEKRAIPASAGRVSDVDMSDLAYRRSRPFGYDGEFSRDTSMDRNPANVFLPVTTTTSTPVSEVAGNAATGAASATTTTTTTTTATTVDGKRKRGLSQSEYADEHGEGGEVTGQTSDQSRRGGERQQHQSRFSLTTIMNTLLGGIPSKVWNFCYESSFRGFHAGGGKGYEMKTAEEPSDSHAETTSPDHMDDDGFDDMETKTAQTSNIDRHPTLDEYRSNRSDFGPRDAFPSPSPSPPPPPPPENNNTSAIGSSWIVVKEDNFNSSNTVNSEHRRVPTATSIFSAPAAYVGDYADNDTLAPPPRKHPRRNTIVHPVTPRPRRVHGPGSGRRRQGWSGSRVYMPSRSIYSNASPSRSGSSFNNQGGSDIWDGSDGGNSAACSPATLEAQRLAAQIRRQEREEDANLRRMNQKLKALIKEGREALGTQIEIDDDFD
ncbi:hypothetical protein AAP_01588 [Ascosphaera apis ARSEF 7405]|uniref:Uncharacterized protein n=1 Tax=Ascosphaera apis ARSEF 7405 TaxID=392613 RepID=A0A166P8T3_9EURO|nr:hypothetical protein AAP_01588 [Ascosphaera apis ARSEF 7405]